MAYYHKFNLCQSIFQEGQQILHLLSSEKMRIGFRAITKQLVLNNQIFQKKLNKFVFETNFFFGFSSNQLAMGKVMSIW